MAAAPPTTLSSLGLLAYTHAFQGSFASNQDVNLKKNAKLKERQIDARVQFESLARAEKLFWQEIGRKVLRYGCSLEQLQKDAYCSLKSYIERRLAADPLVPKSGLAVAVQTLLSATTSDLDSYPRKQQFVGEWKAARASARTQLDILRKAYQEKKAEKKHALDLEKARKKLTLETGETPTVEACENLVARWSESAQHRKDVTTTRYPSHLRRKPTESTTPAARETIAKAEKARKDRRKASERNKENTVKRTAAKKKKTEKKAGKTEAKKQKQKTEKQLKKTAKELKKQQKIKVATTGTTTTTNE